MVPPDFYIKCSLLDIHMFLFRLKMIYSSTRQKLLLQGENIILKVAREAAQVDSVLGSMQGPF